MKHIVLSILFIFSFVSQADGRVNHIYYSFKTGNIEKGLTQYKKLIEQTKEHQPEVLEEMGWILLEQGQKSCDETIELLTLFGAAIANCERSFDIFKGALYSTHPLTQVAAINLLSQIPDDRSLTYLRFFTSSQNPLIRLEAMYQLAIKNDPSIIDQIEAFKIKLIKELTPVFPKLIAPIKEPRSVPVLRQYLNHPNSLVRVSTINEIAQYHREEFLPDIRLLSRQVEHDIQEASAFTLGRFKDEKSIPTLKKLTRSKDPSVVIAASLSLVQMGQNQYLAPIEDLAKKQNLFAISALSDLPCDKTLLYSLLKSDNLDIQLNAAEALLNKKDPACLAIITKFLLINPQKKLFIPSSSQGNTLVYWKTVAYHSDIPKLNPSLIEVSRQKKIQLLIKCFELPEKTFLKLANTLLEKNTEDLIPTVIHLLEKLQTKEAIAILETYKDKVGSPLIRYYCHLALYRIYLDDPYRKNIHAKKLSEYVWRYANYNLIEFHSPIPSNALTYPSSQFELTPKESSQLLIEILETFANSQDKFGIDILLHAIAYGNPKNRYALAGLLIYASH